MTRSTDVPFEPGALAATLRASGLRATGPRLLILEALLRDASHPTPEALHGQLRARHPSLSLSTVYQTLEAFAKVGLCRRVNAGDNRLHVDGTARDHDHALCRACGRIFDVPRTSREVLAGEASLPGDLTLVDVRVEYDVVCADCSRSSDATG